MIIVKNFFYKYDKNAMFDAKNSNVYHLMGHIWSQYFYPIQKTIWMSANFGIKD